MLATEEKDVDQIVALLQEQHAPECAGPFVYFRSPRVTVSRTCQCPNGNPNASVAIDLWPEIVDRMGPVGCRAARHIESALHSQSVRIARLLTLLRQCRPLVSMSRTQTSGRDFQDSVQRLLASLDAEIG